MRGKDSLIVPRLCGSGADRFFLKRPAIPAVVWFRTGWYRFTIRAKLEVFSPLSGLKGSPLSAENREWISETDPIPSVGLRLFSCDFYIGNGVRHIWLAF